MLHIAYVTNIMQIVLRSQKMLITLKSIEAGFVLAYSIGSVTLHSPLVLSFEGNIKEPMGGVHLLGLDFNA